MNNENLLKGDELRTNKQRENCRKGGLASVEARRRKKSITTTLNAFMSSTLVNEKFKANAMMFIDTKDPKGVDLFCATLLKSALDGDIKAMEMIIKLVGSPDEKNNIALNRVDMATNGKDVSIQPVQIEVIHNRSEVKNDDSTND